MSDEEQLLARRRVLVEAVESAYTMRKAQVLDSDRYLEFQRRIDAMTDSVLAIDNTLPQLTALNRRIAQARGVVDDVNYRRCSAENDEQARIRWMRRAALVGGVLGTLLLVVGVLGSPPWWVLGTGVVLAAGAVACFVWSLRWQDGLVDDYRDSLERAQFTVEDLVQERKRLLDAQETEQVERVSPLEAVRELPLDERARALHPRS